MFGLVKEHAEKFFIERVFPYTVMVIKSRLRAPADVERAGDIRLAPFHYAAEFVPVFDLFKRHLLDGSARYDKTVVFVVFHLVEVLVKRDHMLRGRVLRNIRGGLQKLGLDLKRRVSEKARELSLRCDLCRHQVQNEDLQRAYILRQSPRFGHDKDVLIVKGLGRGKIRGYFYRHFSTSSRACLMSAIISSTFSIPTDMRIRSGLIPQETSCSSVNCLCVVEAG